jgi:hypothetical protein
VEGGFFILKVPGCAIRPGGVFVVPIPLDAFEVIVAQPLDARGEVFGLFDRIDLGLGDIGLHGNLLSGTHWQIDEAL